MMLVDDPAQLTPPTMRAWTHSQAGIPSTVLRFSSDVKTPALTSPTDVLVQITHVSLSPAGSIMMQFCPFIFRSKPAIPELDFAGTLIAVGADVPKDRNLAPGDAVFGSVTVRPHLNVGAGALAEYVVVAASSVVRKPEGMALQEAAGLGVCGCTALTLYDRAGLKAGDSVLINGASGGIGTMVTQLARHAVGPSGRIVALCSGKNAKMVRSLGVDEVIDYQAKAPVHQYLATQYSSSRFNVIIDAYGSHELYTHCADYLEPGKPFVTVGVALAEYTVSSMVYASSLMLKNNWWPRALGGGLRDYICVSAFVTLEDLQRLRELVEEGKLAVVLDSCWDMGDVLKVNYTIKLRARHFELEIADRTQAYEILLSRRSRGKIIVKIQNT